MKQHQQELRELKKALRGKQEKLSEICKVSTAMISRVMNNDTTVPYDKRKYILSQAKKLRAEMQAEKAQHEQAILEILTA